MSPPADETRAGALIDWPVMSSIDASVEAIAALVAAMPLPAVVVDRQGKAQASNERWSRLAEETPATGSSFGLGSDWFASCADPDLAEQMGEPWASLGAVLAGQQAECTFDLEIPVGKRVRLKRVLAGSFVLGSFEGVLLTVLELTGEPRLEFDRRRLAAIVEGSSDAIISKDLDGRVLSWNPAAEEIYGYSAEEMIGRSIETLAPEDRPDEIPGLLERIARGERIDQLETVRCRKDGTTVEVSLTISPIRDDGEVVVGASIIARDVSERKALERRLTELATRDALTGAVARSFFEELAERELERGRRMGGSLGLLMIDLDHFKQINDRHGHAAGDAVLTAFVRLVEGELRAVDVIARLGGDEFALLLPETSELGARQLGQRLIDRIQTTQVELVSGERLSFTVSIGTAEALPPATLDGLLDDADRALYEAKRRGRNRVASLAETA